MPLEAELIRQAMWLGPSAAAVLLVLVWRGVFQPDGLRDAPKRLVGFGPIEILVGLGAHFFGGMLGQLTAVALKVVPARYDLASLSPQQKTLLTLMMQGGSVLLVVGVLGFLPSINRSKRRAIGLWPRDLLREICLAIEALVTVVPLALGINLLMAFILLWLGKAIPQTGHTMLEVLSKSPSWEVTAALVISAIVVAPVIEEMVYRGIVQTSISNALCTDHRFQAILLTSILFALIHGGAVPWPFLPGLLVVGMVLGYVYERSGSLLPCILVHSAFNAFNIVVHLA